MSSLWNIVTKSRFKITVNEHMLHWPYTLFAKYRERVFFISFIKRGKLEDIIFRVEGWTDGRTMSPASVNEYESLCFQEFSRWPF